MATIEELKRQNHSLGLFCATCDRWGDADLEALIRQGLGSREVTRVRFRCRDCGTVVDKQLRPPVPKVGAAAGYI
ncbi:MAG: hypothetical protein R3315_02105 [Woeseiaceae bacterium]|nr:hypothetical protein [Woeseiaceae bacterium]